MRKVTNDISDLLNILKINEKKLKYLTSRVNYYRLYSRFTIEKKSGGLRHIEAPRKDLKKLKSK